MKRVLTFLAIMLLPLSVMAMTPVSDSTLSDVTGQSGVNINADLTMNINIGTLAWGDRSGIDTSFGVLYGWDSTGAQGSNDITVDATNTGYIGVNGFDITNLKIRARAQVSDTYGGYNITNVIGGLKPITIDVATSTVYGTWPGAAGVTFVRFGLGSLRISLDTLNFDVVLGNTTAAVQAGTQMLGSVELGDMDIYISPASYVDIYASQGSGVNLAMNVKIDRFILDYVSWGDLDGIGSGVTTATDDVTWMSGTTAGYVGIDSLVIDGPITITGTVSIDVATVPFVAAFPAYGSHGAVSVIHIAFGGIPNGLNADDANFVVFVNGAITGDIKLASVANLGNLTNSKTLGNFFIQGLTLTIADGSWVDIWAH